MPSGATSVFADAIDPRVLAAIPEKHRPTCERRRIPPSPSHGIRRQSERVRLDPALRELATQFSFELFVLDGALGDAPHEPWLSFLELTRATSYSKFARWLMTKGPFDIGLAPLRDMPSNRAKSDIDFLNYSALGLLSVVSDRPPYSNAIKDRGLAVVCPDDGWARSLAEVFESPWRFRSIRERAGPTVCLG